ncbi:MAG: HAD family hydrolase, partial [Lacipirellulaceae bacterium]
PITPAETLYVGNDMRNDIWPAAKVGFKTALFAGDERSLRLREDEPNRDQRPEPDAVVTELDQLPKLLQTND